jgi:hypothetical protein
MDKRKTTYWVVTGLFAVVYFASGLADILRAPPVLETLTHLGFPLYLAAILGPWKIAGAFVVLAPGLPRVKEWAYAGIAFDLIGAAASHGFVGDPAPKLLIPLVLLALTVASYLLRPASRRLVAQSNPDTRVRPSSGRSLDPAVPVA